MKKVFLPVALCLMLSACMPAFLQQPNTQPSPFPIEVDLQATAASQVDQTLQALPSPTLVPSNTAVLAAETSTATPSPLPTQTATPTVNPILLTLTATLGTGTPGTSAPVTPGTITVTLNPAISATPTQTLHPQHYGTMPPNLPSGEITLVNSSRAEVYISLQCTTKDGFTTIIEYPVGRKIEIDAPAGKYVYVVWVGGNKIIGKFALDRDQELTLTIFKDRVQVK
ncbi:MAG: hypothetical protein HYZ23_10650 [Chloroflexi bacterium]|nr:hypothetical protein [Chloroflexota bacterium]